MYNRKIIFSAACMGMLLFGIGLITLGSVVPDLKTKFSLDEVSSGTLFSILPLGVLTGSLLFGPFCDQYGYKILLALSCVFMCIGFEGIAYAPSHALLKICIFLFGLGGGAINGATNAVVADISTKDKGANLSILGVFFGIGALGMPVVLALLKNHFHFEAILSSVGVLTLLIGLFFIIIRFPAPKQAQGFPLKQSAALMKDPALLLIAFFLFFQSSFEAIINNWTTSFLTDKLAIVQSEALYALSLFVVGMTVMRLLIGSVLRNMAAQTILFASFAMTLVGLLLLRAGASFSVSAAGLVLAGAGLAGGFPIMLGFVGSRYTTLSATAFSFVFVIALLGNMLINYAMGLIAHRYGIHNLTNVAIAEWCVMTLLCVAILLHLKKQKQVNV